MHNTMLEPANRLALESFPNAIALNRVRFVRSYEGEIFTRLPGSNNVKSEGNHLSRYPTSRSP